MTGPDIKAARTALGLSQGQFARALGLSGEHARITVSEWERGQKAPSGPVLRLIGIWMHHPETRPPASS